MFLIVVHNIFQTACAAGDEGSISIGHSSNLQDGVTVRTAKTYIGAPTPSASVRVGDRVTVGHAVILEGGVTLEDECLIGIGAALQHGVKARLAGLSCVKKCIEVLMRCLFPDGTRQC